MLGVIFSNRCFVFFLCFLRPIFAFSCSLCIRLSIGTVAPGRPRYRFWDIYGWKRTILSSTNEKPEVNIVICVMFLGSTWLQIRTFVCFRHLLFQGLLLFLNRERYFHLLWSQLSGMNNPAKRGHAPPSGDTPGKNPAKKKAASAHQARSRKSLFQSELKPPVGIYKVSVILTRSNSHGI